MRAKDQVFINEIICLSYMKWKFSTMASEVVSTHVIKLNMTII